MIARARAIAIALLLTASTAHAHALDEYVQALRVGVAADRITLHLALTPGVAVAGGIIARLDVDGDGLISPLEARRYGELMLADLDVSLDGTPRALALITVDVPPPADMREGAGTIRIDAIVHASSHPGRHAISVRNRHLPERSAYLANALLPGDDSVAIVRQERDPRQQMFTLSFEIASGRSSAVGWSLGGAALLLAHAGWRRRRLEEATEAQGHRDLVIW
jgi:hypothetical protein